MFPLETTVMVCSDANFWKSALYKWGKSLLPLRNIQYIIKV